MRRLSTAREVVDALGGVAAMRELTGALPKAVYYWTGQAGTFPSRTYVIMQRALKRRGYAAPAHLWSMLGSEKNAA